MRSPTSRIKHRLQLGAAVVASVGSVWIVSRVISHATRPAKAPPPVVVRYVPPPPPPPVMPKVIAPVYTVPHVTPKFEAALREGDVKGIEAAYSTEESLEMAFLKAAELGKVTSVKWLLDKGADIHYQEVGVTSPLLVADAFPDVTKLILERGAPEAEISVAADACAPNAVARILAKNKAAARPVDGSNPLADVINTRNGTHEKRLAIAAQLLAAGADPDEGDPLGGAFGRCGSSEDECVEMVRLVLTKRPRISGDALNGVVDLANGPTRTKLIDAMLGGKLEPNATAVAVGRMSGEDDAAIIKRLASRGIAWTYHDGEADAVAPLVDAVSSQDVALVRALLDAGAPADHHYKDGRSALAAAIEAAGGQTGEAERIVELLVQRGANVNRRLPDGRPPLFAAAESGDVRVVKAILSAGARVNERVLDETALDAAERSGHTQVARVLDGHGARRAPPPPDDAPSSTTPTRATPKDDAQTTLRRAMGENTL